MKKSIADLEAIRQKAQQQVNIRKDNNGIRVVIGMATCCLLYTSDAADD